MKRVQNNKIKLAFHLAADINLNASKGDVLILDETGLGNHVAYTVPYERFKQDFTVVSDDEGDGDEVG